MSDVPPPEFPGPSGPVGGGTRDPGPGGPAPVTTEPAAPETTGSAAPEATGSAAEPATGAPGRSTRIRRGVIEWGVIIAVAVVAALLLRAFVVQPYFIPSASMYPTLKDGDKVLVDKLSYHMHPIHRGDVVVFKTPPDDHSPGIKDLIKRVIGLPGETIQSGAKGAILINGSPISQPWLTPQAKASPGPSIPRMTIPAGDYFVMGDNRGDSFDSRDFGPISGSLIVGRAFVIVWPVSRIGTL